MQRREARKLEDVPRHELDVILAVFCYNSKKGQGWIRTSLAVMQCSLDRHLKNCDRNHNIFRDCETATWGERKRCTNEELRKVKECLSCFEFFWVSFLLNCYPMLSSNFIWIFQNKNKKFSIFQSTFSQG